MKDAPDEAHPLGPLPSRIAVAGLVAIADLAAGEPPTVSRRGRAVLAPDAWAPDEASFAAGWARFVELHASSHRPGPRDLDRLGLALWAVARERGLDEAPDDAPDGWDGDRVRRHLERAVLQGTQLLRRARWLTLLGWSRLDVREAGDARWRSITLRDGQVAAITDGPRGPGAEPRPGRRRRQALDAAAYDRLRVITTELKRILNEGGTGVLHVGRRSIGPPRLASLLRWL